MNIYVYGVLLTTEFAVVVVAVGVLLTTEFVVVFVAVGVLLTTEFLFVFVAVWALLTTEFVVSKPSNTELKTCRHLCLTVGVCVYV